MSRIVVIGAGIGGLAAAARLAATGHQVTVCEAAGRVGGKLGAFARQTPLGAFGFDTGPTLLTLPQVFTDLFAQTGDPLDRVLTLRRLDTIARYRFADGTEVDTMRDLGRQRDAFDAALGTGAGAAWQRVIDRGAAIWRAVEQPIFGTELSRRTAFRLAARLRHVEDLRAVAPGRSLRGLARTLLTDPRQRLMLERYATYEGSDPRRAPAALAVVPYLEHVHGAWYVEGGLHRIADALATRVTERNGRIRLGTAVHRVLVEGGRVAGVLTDDGERLPADVVVCNADAHLLYGTLLAEPEPELKSATAGRPVRRHVPPADSLSGFVILLGLRGRTPGLAHHTVSYGRAPYDDEFDAVFGRRNRPARPVDDPVIYLNAPRDPAMAPDGHEAVYLLVNAPRDGRRGARGEYDWPAPGVATRYAERILDLLAERGMDLRPRVQFCEVRSPADLARDTCAPGGAIYGRVQHGPLATLQRPANRSRVGGLFLVGGSTHPGGGLPLVAMSGKIVAAAIGGA